MTYNSVLQYFFKKLRIQFSKSGVSWVKSETGPIHEGQGETEETNHSRLVGNSCNKQGNFKYIRDLFLGGHKTNRSPYLPNRMSKVYVEALTDSVTYTI